MKKELSNTDICQKAAKNLGLKSERVKTTQGKQLLLLSDKKGKFFFASPAAPGFYPEVRRWNAHFSGSKLLTQKVLKRLGYKVIASHEVRMTDYADTRTLTKNLDKKHLKFPVLTKPDKGLRGKDIAIAENTKQLKKISENYYKKGIDFMVQPILDQDEYRILVVNNDVMLMHSKHFPCVVGNGTSTIRQLLHKIPKEKKDLTFIEWQYKKQKLRPSIVLGEGRKFAYHLTRKPTTTYYKTTDIPRAVQTWALKLARDIASPVVGIDVFVSGSFNDPKSYTIIELNSNPGFNYLITFCNDDQTPYRIYEKVLKDYFEI